MLASACDQRGDRPLRPPPALTGRPCRQIFDGCGEPKLRRRRQAGGDAPSYDAPDFQRVNFQLYPDSDFEGEPSPLLRVLGQIRDRVSPQCWSY